MGDYRAEWKGHEDALNSRSGSVETELGATVVNQVELDVAPSSQQLPVSLVLSVLVVLVFLNCSVTQCPDKKLHVII